MSNAFGRQVVLLLTNKSGGALVAGDVVVVDTGNNTAVTTTTTAGFTGGIGVVQESIANNAIGRVLLSGYAALVNVNASVTRGNFGKTHTVAKQATDAGSTRGAGTFCQFLTGGTTPTALISGTVDLFSSSLTDPTTTRGDLIARGAAVLARLAVGAAGTVLKSDGTDPGWGYPALTISENFLTGDVTIVSANTFYDGPSLSLAAGTYLLTAKARVSTGSAGTWCVAKLWDGTTAYDAAEEYVTTSGGGCMLPLAATVVLGSTTTVKVSCADNSGGGSIRATPATNNTGLTNKASHLLALRIA